MTTTTVGQAVRTPTVVHVPWWRGRLVQVAVVVGAMVVLYHAFKGDYPWPNSLAWNGLSFELDRFQTWLIEQRSAEDKGIVFTLFDGFRVLVDNLVEWFSRFFLWLTWPGVTAVATLVVWRLGGWKAGALVLAAFASYAASGLWAESMETFALMFVAVALSLLIGIPLGIAAGRSDRANRVLTPLLDAAQIVPAFAYLMPVVLFFSIGYAAGVVATMVYAIPPAVRITALGIRGVSSTTVEAADSLGATRWQMLGKVQLPLARRMILLGVNQTILFALSMVVIAGLIGGGGLGAVVNNGINTSPETAILAGFVIVIMAVALDRATAAIADRTDPSVQHASGARLTPRVRTLVAALGAALAVVIAKLASAPGVYPLEVGDDFRSVTLQPWVLDRIRSVLTAIQDPTTWVYDITFPTGTFVLQKLLLPLQSFLVNGPWFVTAGGIVVIAYLISGLRPAFTALVMLAVIGVTGVWALAMDTLSQVIVATVIAVLIGIVLGIAASESRVVSRIMRPINDVLQTLPQLVYIVPFIYLISVSIVPGIVAGVLYAFPVVVRLVERGINDVAPQSVEAARAFGATRRQILTKVKIPLAGDAIMLGINQGIIMVLAVVVIGGLVGSGALGYEVAQGLVRGYFGQGVIASLAILALGITLDRVTQGSRRGRSAGI